MLLMTGVFAQNPQESFKAIGKIVILTPHGKQTDFYKWYYNADYYEKARKKEFECLQFNTKAIRLK
jgi:hypothetical protein